MTILTRYRIATIAGSLAVCLSVSCSTETRSHDSVIDSFGMWRLTRLGVTKPIKLDLDGRISNGIRFRFPSGASQGPNGWYIGHLYATLEFASNTPSSGAAYVTASVGGAEWAQVRIRVARRNGRPYTEWASASALGGVIAGRARGYIAHIEFANYLTIPSVKSGEAALSFAVQRYYGAVIKRAIVMSDSGLEYSRLAPGRIKISLSGVRVVHRGDSVVLYARIKNVGDRDVRGLSVVSEVPMDLIRPKASTNTSEKILRAHHGFTASLIFRAFKPGVAVFNIAVLARGAGDTADYTVKITP